jgi:transpeptidase family protein
LPVRPERIWKGQKRQVGFRASRAVLVERIAVIGVWPYTIFSVFRTLAALVVLLGATVHAADMNTQLARIMHGRVGTAVMVEVASGRVVASYNPAVAARRLARPGSAFKPFTLLALLQSGKLLPTDSLVCRRNLGGMQFDRRHLAVEESQRVPSPN